MATESIPTPRTPGTLWSSLKLGRSSSGYFPVISQREEAEDDPDLEGQDGEEDEEDDDEGLEDLMDEEVMEFDERSALDKTIDRIGMGAYLGDPLTYRMVTADVGGC